MMKKNRLMLLMLVGALIAFVGGQAYGSLYGFFSGYPVVRIVVDGKEVTGDVPGVLLSGRVMVPVRFVSEALGAEVGWDQSTLTVGVTTVSDVPEPPEDPDPNPAPGTLKAGMISVTGDVHDNAFENNAWVGLEKAVSDFSIFASYAAPSEPGSDDYLDAIDRLIAAESDLIVAPGFAFGNAVFAAQSRPMSPSFLILDGYPHAGDWVAALGLRTVSISFAEHESGFLAGVATALELGHGYVGFIGGMEIPTVQRFNWGFQQGVAYANDSYSTAVEMRAEDVVYQGTFHDVDAGEELAASMYQRGVRAIFAAAGELGKGVINAAKQEVATVNPVWMIGVDIDQYSEGIYDAQGSSVVLTSAMKRLDVAVYDMVVAMREDRFPGGQILEYSATQGAVGIPDNNPNLSAETIAKVSAVSDAIKSGSLKISLEQGDLLP